jgi:hypothetical protein
MTGVYDFCQPQSFFYKFQMKILPKIIVSTMLLSCFVFSGCKQQLPKGMPPLYPCTITLIQDEKPLAHAAVRFHPTDPENFWALAGVSNPQGVIEMTTNGPYKGVPAGVYKITVEKQAIEAIDANRYYQVGFVDPQFEDQKTTPIQIEIQPSKKKDINNHTIDLGKEHKRRLSPLLSSGGDEN